MLGTTPKICRVPEQVAAVLQRAVPQAAPRESRRVTGSPKRKQARQVDLKAKRPKTNGASDLQSVASDTEALGESQLNSLFGVNSHMF